MGLTSSLQILVKKLAANVDPPLNGASIHNYLKKAKKAK